MQAHPRAVQRDRIAHELLDGVQRLALNFVAAHHVDRLRREPDVPGDRNLRIDHAPNHIHALLAAFHLDRLGAAFFHKAGSVVNRLVGVDLIRAIRHVGNQQSVLDAAAHGFDVMQHLVHGDRQRVLVAQHGHGQRVADQSNVDAGLVDQARGGVVVSGQAGDGL